MPEQSKPQASPAPSAGAALELRLVGDINGNFFVARYQRGYRWGEQEVRRLLDDIWASAGKPYSLQPVVVKQRAEHDWELVDGQQRLTTLFLIFAYMQREGLQKDGANYTITYETRPGSTAYLSDPDAARSGSNIDFFHIHAAYECIRAWFEGHGHRRQHVANKLHGYLFESVRVIWYEAPPGLDATTLFTRLNVGRIPLTDAELVKALLLSRSRGGQGRADRSNELAAQWDAIERDLRQPDVWAFITSMGADESPTRITLLLDTVAGGPTGRLRPRFHTFDRLQARIEGGAAQEVWNEVVDLHALVMGWYESRDLYHKIGFLVATGERFENLVKLAAGQTKSAFETMLDRHIRDTLDLSPSDVTALGYDTDKGKAKCEQLLLLMNVEAVRRMSHSSERYSFRLHKAQAWSLEHIHAQHAEGLNKAEQWREWLRLHREALAVLPTTEQERRDALVARIDAAMDTIDRPVFLALASDVAEMFTLAESTSPGTSHSVHSISNLALLSCGDNSALGNAVFEVKRRRILELDRRGAYIPACTRQVFLKYYTDAGAQQIHFWSLQDRDSYLDAMISNDKGVVYPYLKPEEHQA